MARRKRSPNPPSGRKKGRPPRARDETPPFPQRYMMERTMREMFGGLAGPGTKSEKAQNLAYDAMEASDPRRSAALCAQALDLDPDCIDALVHLTCLACPSRSERIDLLRKAVERAECVLGGPKFFRENRGHFWGVLETRPYMRTRALLAQLLLAEGRLDEAIREYEELLRLNPNDNRGLRYALLECFLLQGRLDGVRGLFEQYEDEGSAMFVWARVLERYLSGNEGEAAAALRKARESNPHVEKFVTGQKQMPRKLPDYYGIGDENEAMIAADTVGGTWRKHPAALAWLKQAR